MVACDLYDGRQALANEIISGATGKTVPATRRYQDLLDNKDIVDACSAGKDIYCEKPMTHKVEEGFEIIETAQKNNRIVQIGSQRRSSIHFAKAKELIERGDIGDVWSVEAVLGSNSPCGAWVYPPPPDLSPQNLDWETWIGDAAKRPFDPVRFARWRAYEDYGEGLPGDIYVHSLTGIHYVMGLDAPPQRAPTYGGLYYWKDGRDFPDLMTTLYEYPSLQVAVLMTQMTHEPEVTRFLGTRGTIEVYGDGNRLTVAHQDGKDHDPCYYIYSYPGKRRLMVRTGERALYWAPRTLGVAYALFISVFALDVFGENLSLAKLLLALTIHLIPTGIIVVVLALAWKRERLGFVGFVALGLLYMWITRLRFPVIVYLTISGSAFLIGLLFLANWLVRRKPH